MPLSRQRFIDGDTATTGRTGAASQPFKTIAEFIASRGNASVPDATANYVGWLMPSIAGYTENIAFPAYASTELRADSVSDALGTVITGNVTWANAAGANPAVAAFVSIHNVTVSGSATVTDDVNAPASVFVFSGDELGDSSVALGSFDSHTTTKLNIATFTNAIVGAINAGTAANSAVVELIHSEVSGNSILASELVAHDTAIAVTSIITFGDMRFVGCTFQGAPNVQSTNGTVFFDGPSWKSFLEAGGTRSAGVVVLVVGGYNGGAVEGATLPTGGNVDVSLNGTGATAGYTGSNSGNHYSSSGITGDRSVAILTGGGELDGDTMLITKKDLAAHNLVISNAGTTPVVLGTIPSGSRGFLLAQFNASTGDWVLAACGSLAA